MLSRWAFVVAAIATLAATITVLAPKGTAQENPYLAAPSSTATQGRFTIIINPSVRASGSVWQQEVDQKGVPAWMPMKRY
jgi:hypothetical protein